MDSLSNIKLEFFDHEISMEKYTFPNDWEIFYHKENMMASKELDALVPQLEVAHLPEMLFGYNRLYIANPKINFVYEINPIKMINLTSFNLRKDLLESKDIYYTPNEVKCQYHRVWKNMKIDRDDIQKIEPKEDWTFTSTYMGNYSVIGNNPICQLYPSLRGKDTNKKFTVTEDKSLAIPVEKLGMDNPIIQYMELPLYDDELGDNGITQANIRFRVMKDCFFGLLRNYLRVDNVIIRNVDTRFFHEFGTNYILRNFYVKEITYEALERGGFDTRSSWSLSPNQSDEISRYMGQPIFQTSDKIILY